MVNDRGTIKWTSMMMPEHINMLNQMWNEKEYKTKPIIDAQQLSEMNTKLQLAIHNNLTVRIKYYKNHDFHTMAGKLKSIDINNKQIVLQGKERICLTDILDVIIE
ncbi:YolD-like family protein [Oceanobacillus halophilus]|nr:YolD-like family protein [Oceanobacillus halophilus]